MVNGKLGQLCLIAFLAFMPLEKFLVSGLGPGDAFMVIFMVTSWPVIWRQRMHVRFPLLFPSYVILVGSLIGALSGLDFMAVGKALLQEVYLFLMLLTVANAITERSGLQGVVKAWAIVAAAESTIIMLDRVGIHLSAIGGFSAKAAALGTVGSGAEARAVGTFVNANAAGGYIMLVFFIFLALPPFRNMLVRLGFLGLYALAIVATGSMGAMGGTLVGVIVAGLYWLHQRGRNNLFALGVGTLLTVIVILSLPLLSSFLSSQDQGTLLFELSRAGHKLDKRLALWDTSVGLMAEYPLGIGPNVTGSVAVIGAHSDYVAFISERGPLGFIGLMLVYGEVLFWMALTARSTRDWPVRLAIGALLGGVLGLSIMGTVHETTHGRPVWLLFALIFVYYQLVRAEAHSRPEVLAVGDRPRFIGPFARPSSLSENPVI